jgi:5'-deoxynucleotidase YfbR-like HD superfamily hydrolase
MNNYIYIKSLALIDAIKDIDIYLDDDKTLNLVKDLKQTSRSGKLVRIKKYNLKLPCQSIYSHLLSMAHNADILAVCTDYKFEKKSMDFTAKAIVYHDLAESIIGDIPMFTNKKLSGSHFKSIKQKEKEEKLANSIIANSLPVATKKDFIKTIEFLENDNNRDKDFFIFIDKSEPIIAIWKYIYYFKKQISIDIFLKAMNDFFIGKNVLPYCFNEKTKKLVTFLQNKKNARSYYTDGSIVFEEFNSNVINGKDLKNLVQGQKLQFTKYL